MRVLQISVVLLAVVLAAMAVAAGGDEMLEPGQQFVEFKLEAHDGSTVSSEDLQGQAYLLYFYPKADTPGCTREACELRDVWGEIRDAGLAVYGVSYDSPEKNRAFAEKYNLPFLLLSDSDRELAGEVGAAGKLLPVPKRVSYLVGGDGAILETYPKVDPAPHARQVLEDYERLTG